MLLKEYLNEYTREQLLEQARSFDLKNCSRLRKAALIERITECFCTEEMLRSRLACLTKEQMKIFRKACHKPQDISIHEIMDGLQLNRYWFGFFEEPTDRFCVFEDVAEVFRKIDDEAFRNEQYKKGWMMKCLQFFVNYYGIAPVEIIYKLYRLKVKDTMDEMISMMLEMPVDIVESCIFPADRLGLRDLPGNAPIYSARGLLIHIPLLENGTFESLFDLQMTKDFYIPSAKMIEELCRDGYESSSPAYKKLVNFFMNKLGMPYEIAVTWCLQVWANSHAGGMPMEIFGKMSQEEIHFDSEQQVEEFAGLLMNAHNQTRMIENRGYTPDEMAGRRTADGKIAGGSPVFRAGRIH